MRFVVSPHSPLQLPHALHRQFPGLKAPHIFFSVAAHLEVDVRIFLFVNFELIVQSFDDLLLHFVEQDGGVLGEGFGEGGGLEGLVVPDF